MQGSLSEFLTLSSASMRTSLNLDFLLIAFRSQRGVESTDVITESIVEFQRHSDDFSRIAKRISFMKVRSFSFVSST